MDGVRRIAMWSCPRTVSTAILRSFVEREDTWGVDEPFYAWFLAETGRAHPMREEVLAAQAQDWRTVVEEVLLGPCPRPVQFVKHMAHHMVGDVDLSFADDLCNVFLVRDPREMLPSLQKDLGTLDEVDVGFPLQRALYRRLRGRGRPVAVVDSRDLLEDPEGMLRALCRYAGIAFDPGMLTWEPGRHPCYGVWAPAWYAKVETSTGFRPWQPKEEPFPAELEPLYAVTKEAYDELCAERLRPEPVEPR